MSKSLYDTEEGDCVAFEVLPSDLPSIPLLLRDARGSFVSEIRAAIEAAGMPALPTNGPLVIRRLHQGATSKSQLVSQRQSSIETLQTIEKLHESGYLSGSDGNIVLTELGHEAAHIIFDAINHLTVSLNEYLGDEGMKSFVMGLLYLIDVKESH
jgi:hypothetical protein